MIALDDEENPQAIVDEVRDKFREDVVESKTHLKYPICTLLMCDPIALNNDENTPVRS